MTNDSQKLLTKILKYLSLRPRSIQEVATRLGKYTTDANQINLVIDQLKAAKLLDDAKFAAWLIESRSRSRPRGKRLLIQELKNKGVDLSTLDFQLSTGDEIELARQALKKKHATWSRLSAKDYRLKASRYLAARGFPWSVIEQVIKTGYNDPHVS